MDDPVTKNSVMLSAIDDVTVFGDIWNSTADYITVANAINATTELYVYNSVSVSELGMKVVYMLIGIMGVLGNGLSIIVFLSSKSMRASITNQFLIHQNCIDGIASILILTTIPEESPRVLQGSLGFLYCVFWDNAFLVWLILTVSTFNLVALSLERWLKITKPFFHRAHFNKNTAYVMMSLAWVLSIAYQVSLEASTSELVDGKCHTQSRWTSGLARKALGIVSFTVKLFGPVAIIIYCYSAIIDTIRQSSYIHDQNKQQQKMQEIQHNVLKTLLVIVAVFVTCISWNQVIFLLHNLQIIQLDFGGWNFHLSIVLYFSNCCVNPFIYVIKYQEFRSTMVALCCRKQLEANSDVTNVTMETQDIPSISESFKSTSECI